MKSTAARILDILGDDYELIVTAETCSAVLDLNLNTTRQSLNALVDQRKLSRRTVRGRILYNLRDFKKNALITRAWNLETFPPVE